MSYSSNSRLKQIKHTWCGISGNCTIILVDETDEKWLKNDWKHIGGDYYLIWFRYVPVLFICLEYYLSGQLFSASEGGLRFGWIDGNISLSPNIIIMA